LHEHLQDEDNYILIDGHTRYKICQNLGKSSNIKVFDLETTKDWIILNQLGKRNITKETKSYLRGLQYKNEKKHMEVRGKQEDKLTT
jgi:ParB-like chromosome segregation protein Spo0J